LKGRSKLLFSKVPASCSEDDLRQWVEAKGYEVSNLYLIRDLVTGTSPSFAYVQLVDAQKLDDAARILSGQTLQEYTIGVSRIEPPQFIVKRDRSAVATA
jgi:RNA recognition motif-containing protein